MDVGDEPFGLPVQMPSQARGQARQSAFGVLEHPSLVADEENLAACPGQQNAVCSVFPVAGRSSDRLTAETTT